MGVFKNDVGRPSNKTIMIRTILKGIGLVVLIGLAFGIGYYFNNNQKTGSISKKDNKTKVENKEKVNTDEAKSILKKYSINDDIYFLTAGQFSDNYKVLLTIKKTEPKDENNICEKVNKNYDNTSTKDEWGNYSINYLAGYDEVYCNDEDKFYSYDDLEKTYQELFGKNAKLPNVNVVDNLREFEIFAYLKNPKGYVSLGNELGGYVEDGQTEYIYDAYTLNNEMHIIFSSFFYIDTYSDGKLGVNFSEDIDVSDLDNNLSETDDGKISGDVEQFFIDNRSKIPVYEMILTKEDNNYVFKSIEKVK